MRRTRQSASPVSTRPKFEAETHEDQEIVCSGRHWNAKTYEYEAIRSELVTTLRVQLLPDDLKDLAKRIALKAGMWIRAGYLLNNYYNNKQPLGVHQDKDEGRNRWHPGCFGIARRSAKLR